MFRDEACAAAVNRACPCRGSNALPPGVHGAARTGAEMRVCKLEAPLAHRVVDA